MIFKLKSTLCITRFEESCIKTERTGDRPGVAVEERDGREAPPSKLGGTGWGGQHADDGKMRQGGGGQPPLATAAITGVCDTQASTQDPISSHLMLGIL